MRWVTRHLPFWHHQPPLKLSARRLVIMAMDRPVSIPEMESMIYAELQNDGEAALAGLREGIEYLREKRFYKRDGANLFVATLRAVCTYNPTLGIEFGNSMIDEIPDSRAVRTMVTHLNRQGLVEDSLEMLRRYPRDGWSEEIGKVLKKRLFGPPPENESIGDAPWLFEMKEDARLEETPTFFQHPFTEIETELRNGFSPRFELTGTLLIRVEEPYSAALVSFTFFDANDVEITGIEPSGLVRSRTVGWYSYLKQDGETGEFCIQFEPPVGTRRLTLGFRTWKAESEISIAGGVVIQPSKLDAFQQDVVQFTKDVKRAASDSIIFVFSGTTFVQDLRANRPIRLTREFLSRDIPVIFNYHRWKWSDEWPPYQGDLLLQIPIDVTQTMLGDIAEMDFGGKNKIFIVSYPHPSISKVLNRFRLNGWMTIYDARDEWEEFEKVGQAKWYRTYHERYITRNCDHVTAVSKPLADKLDGFEPFNPVIVVPNALSPHFLSAGYRWKGSKMTKIGYFGHLTESWFDWESLISIAQSRPNYQFEIIGHSAPEFDSLPENIILMGPKNHPEINEIAAEWKVAIIPFKIGPLADGVDPIKIYEYMALGLPTVSFRMPQIKSYPYTITVSNIEDFCHALDEYVSFRPRKEKLTTWLAENRWQDRVDVFLTLGTSAAEDNLTGTGVSE